MNKTVFITGATAGFGAACAEIFAQNGYRLLLNGRRTERLEAAAANLKARYGADSYLLPFDVRDRAAVTAAVATLPAEWQSIDVLINNAGLALGRDKFQDASLDDWETMLDTNVKGLLYVSRAVLPFMLARKRGHIINLGSVAGKEVYERGNVYCASKFAVDALNRSMRIDLLSEGIRVTGIHPGAAETEFSLVRFKGDAATAGSVYQGFQPLRPEDVASVIYYTTTLPPHVCINDLVLTCTAQADAIYFHKQAAV
ncbi:SDR family NAD(P)-dependent oxidoreductase [Flaviaesturariibacter aridisoli]|uniref:SDR family NAD(P)-dependent oxidoreductase n=1 Tax=Flaviaesturariibacter aridisoli TaxID=2545761 RepID=A0A4R4E7U5_9BACT|nr:SDR family NAD(P)-dependent oxidoreductase [Flaviaesturariibacter aridisoli]TCZ75013.1 SDR family NAD(P)-dependent oxidoreductase [Flaviaesturariibacter aridisoli]